MKKKIFLLGTMAVISLAVAVAVNVVSIAITGNQEEPEIIERVVEVPVEVPVEAEQPEPYGIVDATEIPTILDFEVPSDFKPIECDLDDEIQEFTYYIAKAYNIDFTFLMGVMSVESDFNCNTISKTNDYGLMQINKCNHKWLSEKLGITDFLDPYQNIIAGTYIFAGLFEKYEGDYDKVLMAYNMGDGGASKLWKQGIHQSNYSRMVIEAITEMGGR